MVEYLQAPEQDVVISSRVRLSRNYDDLPFSPKLTREYANEVVARTSDAVFRGSGGQSFSLLRMGELEQDARSRLVEHHLISYDLLCRGFSWSARRSWRWAWTNRWGKSTRSHSTASWAF